MWSFKPIVKEEFGKYITYMSKGIYDPSSADCRVGPSPIHTNMFDELKAKWIVKPHVVKSSKSQEEYNDWLKQFKTKLQYRALVEFKDDIIKRDPLIQIVKNDAEYYLVSKNYGFHNQHVANQIINFVRSFLFELKYNT